MNLYERDSSVFVPALCVASPALIHLANFFCTITAMIEQLLIAFALSLLIALTAVWRGSLSYSGGLTAVLVGSLTFALGGWQWGVLLALFFVSSSALSHYKEGQKQAVAEKFDKGHKRDSSQVLANGGLGALTAVANYLWPSPIWWPLFIGLMATVTADTWATELGTLSQRPPRLITNGRLVPVGTSGAISAMGTAVSFVGGLFIGLAAALLSQQWPLLLIGGLAGLAGSLSDSFLGATVQQIFYCDQCQKETEKKSHCGRPTRPLKGWSWMNNDLVNGLSSVAGALVALLFYGLVG